ncbi:hypothetical protein [Mesobacterium pallidum]|nr:hypothetical protein [Mesobacterium pallidum]
MTARPELAANPASLGVGRDASPAWLTRAEDPETAVNVMVRPWVWS